MSDKIIKMPLKQAVENKGKEELLQKLISGEIKAEGIFFQECMTEAEEMAEDFKLIPRSAWSNYAIQEADDLLSITVDLDHDRGETLFQGYSYIFVLMPNLKASLSKDKTQTRVHEHHEFIGKVALKLRSELQRHPKADEVWDYFEENWEDFDSVIDMTDKQIVFTTSKGRERPIVKATFTNIVSDYLTGKKEII